MTKVTGLTKNPTIIPREERRTTPPFLFHRYNNMTNLKETQATIVKDGRLKLIVVSMITLCAVGKWNKLIPELKDKSVGTETGATDTFEWIANVNWMCGTEKKLIPTKISLSLDYKARITAMSPGSGRGIECLLNRINDSDELFGEGRTFAPGQTLVLEDGRSWHNSQRPAYFDGWDQGAEISLLPSIVCFAAVQETEEKQ